MKNSSEPQIDQTLLPELHSWVPSAKGSDFPIQNLPYGVFSVSTDSGDKKNLGRVGIAVGDQIIDLASLHEAGLLQGLHEFQAFSPKVFMADSLNPLIALGEGFRRKLRERVSALLDVRNTEISENQALRDRVLLPMKKVEMKLPMQAGDFVDFYSSLEHASNVGSMFRDPSNPLLPNWKHIPIGYHGRSSSLMVSGQNFYRPCGQLKAEDAPPVFQPSKQMDFELEMGFVVGKNTSQGDRVNASLACEHMFGMVLVNDWSARDIQKWEYVPLGPFLGKSFATTVSPWVVPMEVVRALRTAEPERDVPILSYLEDGGDKALDIELTVLIQTQKLEEPEVICRTNFKHMYWTINQQLAHMTSNGTPIRVGDLYASGTVSGKSSDSYGSMLELCWKGTKPFIFSNGEKRVFLEDYDRVILQASATLAGGIRIGFGSCSSQILPARL